MKNFLKYHDKISVYSQHPALKVKTREENCLLSLCSVLICESGTKFVYPQLNLKQIESSYFCGTVMASTDIKCLQSGV